MKAAELWIDNGNPVELEPAAVQSRGRANMLKNDRMVMLAVTEDGTHIQWHLRHASWSSLFTTIAYLKTCPSPVHLEFYANGWLRETYTSSREAASRIDELVSKSDINLSRRAFVSEREVNKTEMPQLLQLALNEHRFMSDFRIDHRFDTGAETFYIEHVGSASALGKIMGKEWTDHAQGKWGTPDTGYDRQVMPPYFEVFESGKPRYDHVYAAITRPGRDPVWVPYRRLIVPSKCLNGKTGITVISELGDVDINPI